jgi:hypothetical protein
MVGLMMVAGATGPEDARRIREAAGGARPGAGLRRGARDREAIRFSGPNGLKAASSLLPLDLDARQRQNAAAAKDTGDCHRAAKCAGRSHGRAKAEENRRGAALEGKSPLRPLVSLYDRSRPPRDDVLTPPNGGRQLAVTGLTNPDRAAKASASTPSSITSPTLSRNSFSSAELRLWDGVRRDSNLAEWSFRWTSP